MIGKKICKFDTLESTNNYIKQNINILKHGDVVLARVQTKGRGRFGNTWDSVDGNLYFSVLLKQVLSREDVFIYTIKSSVALVRTLNHYNIESKIKYPNDILVNDKKISGILIESSGYENIDYIVLGIGLNVNQRLFYGLQEKATSMGLQTNNVYDIDDILNQFTIQYNGLNSKESVYEEYIKYSMLLNTTVSYGDEQYLVKSIDYQGNIKLINNKMAKTVSYNNISFANNYKK
ncbi:biotin--[acetyl-CoA-carboxylase] ligase [Mycoplasmatota bacterium WC30]